jgi:hypothetical protein
MKCSTRTFSCLAALALCFAAPPIRAQRPEAPAGIAVFLDCGFMCDEEFIHTEITYVDWVRDRTAASVHLLVTTEGTGGGGTQFTLAFLGQQRFAGRGDTLHYAAGPTATSDETRRGLVRVMKVGLVPYLARTTLLERMDVSVSPRDSGAAPAGAVIHDPWNFWVFTTSLNGNGNGDRNNVFTNLNGSLNARRTTDQWKISLNLRENYNQSDFTIDSATSTFIRRSYSLDQLAVRSFGPRWSAGVTSSLGSSTFENKKFSIRVAPAVEYDIFPYAESTRRMLTLQYAVGVESFRYLEESIYDKLADTHPLHTLSLNLSQNQPWGNVNLGVNGSQYLDATNLNSAGVFLGTNVRVYKGLNVSLSGNYSAIRNQIFLPRSGATEQEILLQQRQLATSYSYFVFFGINYTFGSLLNNIVNPRFGRDGGGMMFFF